MPQHPRRVYFMRPVGMRGPVKVGCSTATEARRLVLSKWSPFKLEIATWIEGGYDLERRFHTLFRKLHTHCEWFKWSPEMESVIVAINAGTFDVDTLPEGRGIRDPRSYASGPMWSFRGHIAQRMSAVRARGVLVPQDVARAHDRLRGRVKGVPADQPVDAEVLQRFLALHGFPKERFPAGWSVAGCPAANDTPPQEAAA